MSAKFPSFKWQRGVSADKRISIVHRLILLRLCLYRNDADGRCNPGYDTVAEELPVHRATVFRAIDAGVKWGWLAQPVRHGQANADFYFTFPPDNVATVRPHNVAPERPQRASKVAPVRTQGRTRANDTSSKRTEERERGKSQTRPPDVAHGSRKGPTGKQGKQDDAFARFWAAYPKKVDRLRAEKAFAAALKRGADAEAVIAATARYAAERAGEPERYTKNPATWLNAGSYLNPPSGKPIIDEVGNVVGYAASGPTSRREAEEDAEAEFLIEYYESGDRHG
jgi:hypothetical protein